MIGNSIKGKKSQIMGLGMETMGIWRHFSGFIVMRRPISDLLERAFLQRLACLINTTRNQKGTLALLSLQGSLDPFLNQPEKKTLCYCQNEKLQYICSSRDLHYSGQTIDICSLALHLKIANQENYFLHNETYSHPTIVSKTQVNSVYRIVESFQLLEILDFSGL